MNSHLMIYTLSGCGQLIHEGIGFELGPNSLVSFDCRKAHFYHTQSDVAWEFLYCHYSGSSVDLYDGLLNDNNLTVTTLNEAAIISDELENMLQLVQTQNPQKELKVCQSLLSIYTHLILSKKITSNVKKHREYTREINQVISFIHEITIKNSVLTTSLPSQH